MCKHQGRYDGCLECAKEYQASESELNELLDSLGITDEWKLENIKETAMNRHSIKKNQKAFFKRVLDEAFLLLKRERI